METLFSWVLQCPAPYSIQLTRVLATTWAFTSLSTASFCARLFLRWYRFKKLYWDDFFVSCAWAFSIPLAAQVTVSLRHIKTAKEAPKTDSIFISRPVVQFFFYSCVWSIKFSFLLFFRRIGTSALKGVKIYWRIVLGFTILSYLILFTLNPYHCWIRKGLRGCATDPRVQQLWLVTFPLAAAFDLITDLLSTSLLPMLLAMLIEIVMIIPFAIISHVRLSTRQSLALYLLFSLVILTMGVIIARLVISVKSRFDKDLTVALLIFLADIEANTGLSLTLCSVSHVLWSAITYNTVAIFVACIGAVRTLFTQQDRPQPPIHQSPYPLPLGRTHHMLNKSTDVIVSVEVQELLPDAVKTTE